MAQLYRCFKTGLFCMNSSNYIVGVLQLPSTGQGITEVYHWLTSQHNLANNLLLPIILLWECGRRGGLMVSAPDSGASVPGLSPGQGHCVVFLGKTLYSHSASLHPGV